MNNVILPERMKVFLFILLLLPFYSFLQAEEDVITTIILINREAELVDLNEDGEILKRHVSIPDYFSSGRSHNSSLRKSLNSLKDYGSVNYHIPGSSSLPAEDLQQSMIRLTDECSLTFVNDLILEDYTINSANSLQLLTHSRLLSYTEPQNVRIRRTVLLTFYKQREIPFSRFHYTVLRNIYT